MTTDSDFARLDFEINDAPRETHAAELPRERRMDDREMLELVREVFVVVNHLRNELTMHIAAEDKIIAEAFPAGSIAAHKLWHEAIIEKEQAKARFWQDIQKSAYTWGIIGAILFIIVAVWERILRGH